MKKVSLQDIANRLNVSKALVSFVLNGQGDEKGINAKTQQRVLKMAHELNYKPNYLARGLRLGKSHTIGMVVADISNKFYAKIAKRVEEVAAKNNYHLIFSSSDENPEKEIELIEMLRDRLVDGIIVSTTQRESSYFTQLKKQNYPFVLIDRQIPRLKTNYVGVDNYGGAYMATQHLILNGCKRIGLMKISPSFLSSIREREAGYRAAMHDHGMRIQSRFIREIDFSDIRNGVDSAFKELQSPHCSIDGLFAMNNNITIACLENIFKMRVQMPRDLKLVSFDDIELFEFSSPTISAISQPLENIGEQAVNMLMELINGNHTGSPVSTILPVNFIGRQSSMENIDGQNNRGPEVILTSKAIAMK